MTFSGNVRYARAIVFQKPIQTGCINMTSQLLSIVFAAAASVSIASACEAPLYDPEWGGKPVRVGENCAFDRGGPYDGGDITGNAIQAFGAQLTVQVITNHYACNPGDALLVVDCADARLILISSVPHPRDAEYVVTAPPTPLKNIMRPRGEIRLTRKTSLDRLERTARRMKYPYTKDPSGTYFAGIETSKGFDPFCGCKLYYPGSAGASQ